MWNCEKCGNVKVKCGNDSVGMWELGLGISITKLGLLDSVLYSHNQASCKYSEFSFFLIIISIFNFHIPSYAQFHINHT